MFNWNRVMIRAISLGVAGTMAFATPGYATSGSLAGVIGIPVEQTTAAESTPVIGGVAADMKRTSEGMINARAVLAGVAGETEKTEEEKQAAQELASQVEEKAEKTQSPSPYDNVAIAQVAGSVRVRSDASTDSGVVGKIFNNGAATILDTVEREDGKWYKIQSGSVEGYIKSDYFVTGEEAEAIAYQVGKVKATVKPETLRLRSHADSESSVVTLLSAEEKYDVIAQENGFAKLVIDDDVVGYVDDLYVDYSVSFNKAVSVDEEEEAVTARMNAQTADSGEETSSDDDDHAEEMERLSKLGYDSYEEYLQDIANDKEEEEMERLSKLGYDSYEEYLQDIAKDKAEAEAKKNADTDSQSTSDDDHADEMERLSKLGYDSYEEYLEDIAKDKEEAQKSEDSEDNDSESTSDDDHADEMERLSKLGYDSYEEYLEDIAKDKAAASEDDGMDDEEVEQVREQSSSDDDHAEEMERLSKLGYDSYEEYLEDIAKDKAEAAAEKSEDSSSDDDHEEEMERLRKLGYDSYEEYLEDIAKDKAEAAAEKSEDSSSDDDHEEEMERLRKLGYDSYEEYLEDIAKDKAEAAAEKSEDSSSDDDHEEEMERLRKLGYDSYEEYLEDMEKDKKAAQEAKSSDDDDDDDDGGSYSSSSTREAIVDYALSFVGSVPYVYGGNSLKSGVDCSGFVKQVFKHFGISLPRSSDSQGSAGRSVKSKNKKPGDIVYYGGHVAIYIGGGEVVHASNEKSGIKVSTWNYRSVASIRNVID